MTTLEIPPQHELDRSAEKPSAAEPTVHWGSLVLAGGLVGYGLTRPMKLRGWMAAAAGYALLRRGSNGQARIPRAEDIQAAVRRGLPALGFWSRRGVRVARSFTVQRSREETFRLWQDVERWPEFMRHIEPVARIGEHRFHVLARGLSGRSYEWNMEMAPGREGESLGWSSVEGDMETEGSVHLQETIGDRGTIVAAVLGYRPARDLPATAVADFFHPGLKGVIEEDLRRFKQLIETGEIPTTEGQPSGPRSAVGEAVPV